MNIFFNTIFAKLIQRVQYQFPLRLLQMAAFNNNNNKQNNYTIFLWFFCCVKDRNKTSRTARMYDFDLTWSRRRREWSAWQRWFGSNLVNQFCVTMSGDPRCFAGFFTRYHGVYTMRCCRCNEKLNCCCQLDIIYI